MTLKLGNLLCRPVAALLLTGVLFAPLGCSRAGAVEHQIPDQFTGTSEEVEAQLRAPLVATCWDGDVAAVRAYAARLRPQINDRSGLRGDR